MNKPMRELRDKMSREYAILEEYPNTVWRRQGFKNGFDACYAIMKAKAEEMLVKSLDDLSDPFVSGQFTEEYSLAERIRQHVDKAIKQWREFVGESND